jgi:hypothetical protein
MVRQKKKENPQARSAMNEVNVSGNIFVLLIARETNEGRPSAGATASCFVNAVEFLLV